MKFKETALIFGVTLVILVCIFVVIYLWFSYYDLEKKDWLLFLGGFLSFAGTIIVTVLLIVQNQNFQERQLEKDRHSVLPYLRVSSVFDYHQYFEREGGYFRIPHPYLCLDSGNLKWHGIEKDERVAYIEKDVIDAAYKVENIGVGSAMKVSIRTQDFEKYDFNNHLKVNDEIFFRIDIGSLTEESQEFLLTFSFYDIYNNFYEQDLKAFLIIEGYKFTFNVQLEQFEPKLISQV